MLTVVVPGTEQMGQLMGEDGGAVAGQVPLPCLHATAGLEGEVDEVDPVDGALEVAALPALHGHVGIGELHRDMEQIAVGEPVTGGIEVGVESTPRDAPGGLGEVLLAGLVEQLDREGDLGSHGAAGEQHAARPEGAARDRSEVAEALVLRPARGQDVDGAEDHPLGGVVPAPGLDVGGGHGGGQVPPRPDRRVRCGAERLLVDEVVGEGVQLFGADGIDVPVPCPRLGQQGEVRRGEAVVREVDAEGGRCRVDRLGGRGVPGEMMSEQSPEGAQGGGVDGQVPGEGVGVTESGAEGGGEADGLGETAVGEEVGGGGAELREGRPARGAGGTGESGERPDIDVGGEAFEAVSGFEVPAGDRLAHVLVGGAAEVFGAAVGGVPGAEGGEVGAAARPGGGLVTGSGVEAGAVHGAGGNAEVVHGAGGNAEAVHGAGGNAEVVHGAGGNAGAVHGAGGNAEVVYGGREPRGVLEVPQPGDGVGVGVEPGGDSLRAGASVLSDETDDVVGVVQSVCAQESFQVVRLCAQPVRGVEDRVRRSVDGRGEPVHHRVTYAVVITATGQFGERGTAAGQMVVEGLPVGAAETQFGHVLVECVEPHRGQVQPVAQSGEFVVDVDGPGGFVAAPGGRGEHVEDSLGDGVVVRRTDGSPATRRLGGRVLRRRRGRSRIRIRRGRPRVFPRPGLLLCRRRDRRPRLGVRPRRGRGRRRQHRSVVDVPVRPALRAGLQMQQDAPLPVPRLPLAAARQEGVQFPVVRHGHRHLPQGRRQRRVEVRRAVAGQRLAVAVPARGDLGERAALLLRQRLPRRREGSVAVLELPPGLGRRVEEGQQSGLGDVRCGERVRQVRRHHRGQLREASGRLVRCPQFPGQLLPQLQAVRPGPVGVHAPPEPFRQGVEEPAAVVLDVHQGVGRTVDRDRDRGAAVLVLRELLLLVLRLRLRLVLVAVLLPEPVGRGLDVRAVAEDRVGQPADLEVVVTGLLHRLRELLQRLRELVRRRRELVQFRGEGVQSRSGLVQPRLMELALPGVGAEVAFDRLVLLLQFPVLLPVLLDAVEFLPQSPALLPVFLVAVLPRLLGLGQLLGGLLLRFDELRQPGLVRLAGGPGLRSGAPVQPQFLHPLVAQPDEDRRLGPPGLQGGRGRERPAGGAVLDVALRLRGEVEGGGDGVQMAVPGGRLEVAPGLLGLSDPVRLAGAVADAGAGDTGGDEHVAAGVRAAGGTGPRRPGQDGSVGHLAAGAGAGEVVQPHLAADGYAARVREIEVGGQGEGGLDPADQAVVGDGDGVPAALGRAGGESGGEGGVVQGGAERVGAGAAGLHEVARARGVVHRLGERVALVRVLRGVAEVVAVGPGDEQFAEVLHLVGTDDLVDVQAAVARAGLLGVLLRGLGQQVGGVAAALGRIDRHRGLRPQTRGRCRGRRRRCGRGRRRGSFAVPVRLQHQVRLRRGDGGVPGDRVDDFAAVGVGDGDGGLPVGPQHRLRTGKGGDLGGHARDGLGRGDGVPGAGSGAGGGAARAARDTHQFTAVDAVRAGLRRGDGVVLGRGAVRTELVVAEQGVDDLGFPDAFVPDGDGHVPAQDVQLPDVCEGGGASAGRQRAPALNGGPARAGGHHGVDGVPGLLGDARPVQGLPEFLQPGGVLRCGVCEGAAARSGEVVPVAPFLPGLGLGVGVGGDLGTGGSGLGTGVRARHRAQTVVDQLRPDRVAFPDQADPSARLPDHRRGVGAVAPEGAAEEAQRPVAGADPVIGVADDQHPPVVAHHLVEVTRRGDGGPLGRGPELLQPGAGRSALAGEVRDAGRLHTGEHAGGAERAAPRPAP